MERLLQILEKYRAALEKELADALEAYLQHLYWQLRTMPRPPPPQPKCEPLVDFFTQGGKVYIATDGEVVERGGRLYASKCGVEVALPPAKVVMQKEGLTVLEVVAQQP